MMSIRELRLLLEISQVGFEAYKKHDRGSAGLRES